MAIANFHFTLAIKNNLPASIFYIFKPFFWLFYLESCPIYMIKISLVCKEFSRRYSLPYLQSQLPSILFLRHTRPCLLLPRPWNLYFNLCLCPIGQKSYREPARLTAKEQSLFPKQRPKTMSICSFLQTSRTAYPNSGAQLWPWLYIIHTQRHKIKCQASKLPPFLLNPSLI